MADLSRTFGVDHLAAATIGGPLARAGISSLLFLLLVALLMAIARLVLVAEQALLLLGLTFIPVAPALGVEPALVVVSMVTTVLLWYVPTQAPEYMLAFAASDGKLYTHAQARRVAFGYAGVVLVGLLVSVPYWHLLGLL